MLSEVALQEHYVSKELILLVGQHDAGMGGGISLQHVQVLVIALAPLWRARNRLEARQRVAEDLPKRAIPVVLIGVHQEPSKHLHAHKSGAPHEAVEAARAAVRAPELRERVVHVDLVPGRRADLHTVIVLAAGDGELGRLLDDVAMQLSRRGHQERALHQDLDSTRGERETVPAPAQRGVETKLATSRWQVWLNPDHWRRPRILHQHARGHERAGPQALGDVEDFPEGGLEELAHEMRYSEIAVPSANDITTRNLVVAKEPSSTLASNRLARAVDLYVRLVPLASPRGAVLLLDLGQTRRLVKRVSVCQQRALRPQKYGFEQGMDRVRRHAHHLLDSVAGTTPRVGEDHVYGTGAHLLDVSTHTTFRSAERELHIALPVVPDKPVPRLHLYRSALGLVDIGSAEQSSARFGVHRDVSN
mmetsp:Transcript_21336/g.60434  ORF Transcript_21336/g.60434 Transcript_21336/m.60434 type:complete len:419 (+) Transcript_21336:1614-2870(+)